MWPTTSLDFYCISTPQQLSKVSTFLCYELTKTNMAMCAFEKDRVSVCWREKTGRQGHTGCCCSAYWQMSACMYPYLSMFNGCFHKQQIKSQIICFLCYGWGEKNNQTEPYQCCTKNHKEFCVLERRLSQRTSELNNKSFLSCLSAWCLSVETLILTICLAIPGLGMCCQQCYKFDIQFKAAVDEGVL